jgi:hypothetical protein
MMAEMVGRLSFLCCYSTAGASVLVAGNAQTACQLLVCGVLLTWSHQVYATKFGTLIVAVCPHMTVGSGLLFAACRCSVWSVLELS